VTIPKHKTFCNIMLIIVRIKHYSVSYKFYFVLMNVVVVDVVQVSI